MELIEIEEKDKEKYEAFVEKNGRFLQSLLWGEFQKSLGKDVYRFAVEDNGEYLLTSQGYLNRVGSSAYYFSPHGPVTGTDDRAVWIFFAEALKKKFPQLIFSRFEPFSLDPKISPRFIKTIELDPHKTLILDLQKGLETLLEEMHQKTRYNIRLAEKKGVEVKISNDFSEAVDLFKETSERAGIRMMGSDYYQSLIRYFKDSQEFKATLYTAWHEGDVLAANLMVYYKDTAIYLFGASGNVKRNLMAPYLLHWHAIQNAKEAGYVKYDFWGVEEDPNHPWYGFSKFKLGFGGEIIHYAGAYDYVYSRAWYNGYKILRKLNRLIKR
jgi:lipid II:glycine glycyltransferase (peptidoglycan interpeptide bridge formation enzyme)